MKLEDLTLHPQSPRDQVAVQLATRGGRLDRVPAVRRARMHVTSLVARAGGLARLSTPQGLVVHVPTWDSQQLVMAGRSPLLPPYMVNAIQRAIEPNSLVIDGGANLGAFSLCTAAALQGSGHVLAFEPDPRNVRALAASVASNGFGGVISVIPAALADAPGTFSFWLSEADGALSSLIRRSGADQEVRVEAVTLDAYLLERFGDARADVVKLDIEGGEGAALEGMRRTLPSVRLLVFEVNQPQLRLAGRDPLTVATDFIRTGDFRTATLATDHTGQVWPFDADRLRAILDSEGFVNVVCSR